MGNEQSIPQMEKVVYEPPTPTLTPTGPNGSITWADSSILIAGDAIRKFHSNQQKYINKVVHWLGTLIGIDSSQNALQFKMNPSYTADQKRPDVVLILQRPLLCDLFQSLIGKQFDFTGKIQSNQNGQAILQFANYDIYQKSDIPQNIREALKANTHPSDNLQIDIKDSPIWQSFVTETYPVTIRKMFNAFSTKPAAITCELVKAKSPKELLVKTNLPGASVFMQPNPVNPPHDMVVVLGASTTLPPMARPGAVLTCFGNYASIDQQFVPTLQCNQLQHQNQPDASIAKLSTVQSQITWNQEELDKIKKFRSFGETCNQYLASCRGASRPQSTRSESSQPNSVKAAIGVPVIRPQIKAPGVPQQQANVNATVEPSESAKELSQPSEKQAEEQNPEQQQEPVVEEVPNDQKVIVDESGAVKLEEQRSEFAGKNLTDVAAELMRQAPKTVYTQTAIMAGMHEEEDNEALNRVRALRQSGFLNEFQNKADEHLDALSKLVGGETGNTGGSGYGQTDYYNQTGQTDYYGGGASTTNNYGSGNDYYGGGNNYGSTDYNSSNYGNNNYDYNSGNSNNYDYNSNNYGGNNNNGW